MRLPTLLLLATALATAAPTPQAASDTPADTAPTSDPSLPYTPGTAITPTTCLDLSTYSPNLCPARLPSTNLFSTAAHQVVSAAAPSTVQQRSFNALEAGFTVAGEELRTLALVPALPATAAGKLCRLHFITDGGVNLQPRSLIDHWEVYAIPAEDADAAGVAWNVTTWETQPALPAAPVARFQTDSGSSVAPDAGTGEAVKVKVSHTMLSGEDFECPTGKTVWVVRPVALGGTPETTATMFVGGQNGLGIEVLGTGGEGGWPELFGGVGKDGEVGGVDGA
ncbi:hypothetical protein EDC01DRAFT_785970 [Geopyxis carbonaria]|nr:hypothetical protein EDC01DRAFT_785970 [Geopyxis carbonaria]